MARLLIIATHGSEDPTKAGLAFLMAQGAVEGNHKPEVILAGDASVPPNRSWRKMSSRWGSRRSRN